MSITYSIILAECEFPNATLSPQDGSPLIWMAGSISSSGDPTGTIVRVSNWCWYALLGQGYNQGGILGLQTAIASAFVGAAIAQNLGQSVLVAGFTAIDVSALKGPFPVAPTPASGDVKFGGTSVITLVGQSFTVTV